MSSNYFIRDAGPSDAEAIVRLIKDLAIYEKEPESAKATPELIRENIFEKGYGNAILAFSGSADAPGEAVGLALYFFNFSTWNGKPGLYLEDLFVKEEYRGLGIAKALFQQLGTIAKEKGCARVEWVVLKWNQPSIDFYEKKLGATQMSGWVGMRLEGEGVDRLRQLS